MGLPTWLSSILVLFLVGGNLSPTLGVREILLNYNTSFPKGFRSDAYTVLDQDGNTDKPTVAEVDGHIVVYIATMPKFGDASAATEHENNFVYFPYISNPAANEMIGLRYTISRSNSCPNYGLPTSVQCYNHITLLLVSMNSSSDVNTIDPYDSPMFAMNVTGTTADDHRQHYIQILSSTQGFRLVVHDGGADFVLKNVVMTRYYCHYIPIVNRLPISCPDTPAADQLNATANCVCVDANSSPSKGTPTISEQCVFDAGGPGIGADPGRDPSADFERPAADHCNCNPGFEYTEAPDGVRFCNGSEPQTTLPLTSSPHLSGPHSTQLISVGSQTTDSDKIPPGIEDKTTPSGGGMASSNWIILALAYAVSISCHLLVAV